MVRNMVQIKFKHVKAILVLLAVTLSGNLFSAEIGKFSLVIGTVEVREGGGAWKTVKTGNSVTDNMEINTAYKSSAVITLQNGSRLKIDQASFLAMEKYKTGEFGSATDMSLKQGSVTAFVEKIQTEGQQNHMRIRTPTLVAGVRGTVEEVRHDPDTGTQVILHESEADVVNRSGRVSRVPQGGSHNADSHGNSQNASQNSNNKNNVVMKDDSMDRNEENGLQEREDPTFAGNGADVEELMDNSAHRLNDMQDFLERQQINIPLEIERL